MTMNSVRQGRSMLRALAGFHLKDSLAVHLGFRSVF